MECVKTFPDHKYAVTVGFEGNQHILTGSQDGVLKVYCLGDFSLIRSVKAHDDILRGIVYRNGLIYTCSNDMTVKVWNTNLDPISTLSGHSSFIFANEIITIDGEAYVLSGGEDFKIKLYKNNKEFGGINYPSVIWDIKAINGGPDLVVAGEDGHVRLLSLSNSGIDVARHESFIENADIIALKKPEVTQEDLSKFPSVSEMERIKGTKQGQIKVFVDKGKGMAYSWQNGRWELIGEVTGTNPKSGYEGDQFFPKGDYDFIFDIQDEAGVSRKLPFNKGDNALLAAEKFLAKYNMSTAHKEQIINFINKNVTGGETKTIGSNVQTNQINNAPVPQEQPKQTGKKLKQFPATEFVYFEKLNTEALGKKIQEINEKFKGDEAQKHKAFTVTEEIALSKLLGVFADMDNMQSTDIDPKAITLLNTKLLTWNNDDAIPIVNLYRAFLIHHNSAEIFSSVDNGLKFFIYAIALSKFDKQPLFCLILKFFINVFKQNGFSFVRNESIIFEFLQIKAPLFGAKAKSLLVILYLNYLSFLIQVNKHQSIQTFFDIVNSLDLEDMKGNTYDSDNYVLAMGNSLVFGETGVIEKLRLRKDFIKNLKSCSLVDFRDDVIEYFAN